MTQEQFEMIEQMMLNLHNDTVAAIARFVKALDVNSPVKDVPNLILETFLFKNLNDLRQYNGNIYNIESGSQETQIS